MRRVLFLTVIVLATSCGGRKEPVAWDQLTNSEAVKVLRDDHSPYRVIYYPPVDLTKKPAS
jgi:hypothetical protein